MVKHLIVIVAVLLPACGAGPTVAPEPDLSVIVLDANSAPEGTSQDESGEELTAVVQRVVISGRESQFLELPGLSAGRYSQFSGDAGLFLSLGVQFDSVENADRAFDLFLDELESPEGYGLDSRTSEDVGEEGKCTEGPNPDLGGIQERICLWRTGPVILVAGGTLTWSDTHDIAHGMDSRAR
jgi:hypothetical protein